MCVAGGFSLGIFQMELMCAAICTRRQRGSELTFYAFVHVLLIHLLDADLFMTSHCKDAQSSVLDVLLRNRHQRCRYLFNYALRVTLKTSATGAQRRMH